MKIRIEVDESLGDEIVIRCSKMDERILRMQEAVVEKEERGFHMMLRKGETEYFLPVEDILFFETEGKVIYAHTREHMLATEYKLYELEEILPGSFLRISKSAIVNLDQVYSITRSLTSSSLIEFQHSNKRAYVSRIYYKLLMERLAVKRKQM